MTNTPLVLYSHQQLAAILVKENRFHVGLYEVAYEFQIAIGTVGPTPDQLSPGALFGVGKVGLSRVDQPTPFSVDAAVVNPAPNKKVKTESKSAAPKKAAAKAPKT